MHVFRKHKKYFTVLLLILCSSFTMLAFQNCGPAIQSQNSSSTAGTSTTSSTPNPNPAPVPLPGTTPVPVPVPAPVPVPVPVPVPTPVPPTGPVITPLTAAERQAACAGFLDTTKPASLTVSVTDLTLSSGLGNGSGDASTATFVQTITTGLRSNPVIPVPTGRSTAPATCTMSTTVSCDVANDPAHPATFTKAMSMNTGMPALYGTNEAVGADQAKMNAIAANVANRNNTCSTALATTELVSTRTTPALGNVRNANGYRCVNGSYWIRMGVRTTIEGSTSTPAPSAVTDYKYIKITVRDTCWAESRLKAPADLPRLSRMGNQLAVTDTWTAAVAPVDNNGSVIGTGAVYMFRNSSGNWNYHSKIVMSSASTNDTVTAAGISGNIMVISSQNRSTRQGIALVYLFDGTNWNYYQALTPPVARTAPQLFGASVAFSGSHLVIGAPAFSNNASGNDLSGTAYVYSCVATAPVCTYRAQISNTRKAGAAFGSAVAISGNRVAIGAPQAISITDQGDGFVEVFDIAAAPVSAGYLAPATANRIPAIDDAPTGMRFGASVDINGVAVAVGAPNYNDNTTDRLFSGVAYYFADFASPAARILNTAAADRANNGQSVALNASGLYVGCPNCTGGEGLVRFYPYSTMALGYTLFSTNKLSNSAFGYAMKATNSYLAVGSPVMADPNVSGGASYVFRLP